jgi:hypothetical protein
MLGFVNVNVNDFGVLGEGVFAACHTVGETRAERDE